MPKDIEGRLPIEEVLPSILDHLKFHSRLVVVAPPGAGKTTRLPPAILNGLDLGGKQILVLQPRRIAVKASARRIAQDQGWELGEVIGYEVRFDSKQSSRTQIKFITEGILQRQLLNDISLSQVGVVVFDEFHERRLHSDVALALVKEVQANLRPDLKIVVMSATLDHEKVSDYLGKCHVIISQGRPFPVDITYSQHSLIFSGGESLAEATFAKLTDCIRLDETEGDILVFLPGLLEIRKTEALLLSKRNMLSSFEILTLHGSLKDGEQDRVFAPTSRRKIILSTNLAETSITLPGVRVVIDSGLVRRQRFLASVGTQRLELQKISRASADQRAGRAGRTGPGKVFRLWNRLDHDSLPQSDEPEVRFGDPTESLLVLSSWGVKDFFRFDWLDAPPVAHIESCLQMLSRLNVLDSSLTLTPLGDRLSRTPLSLRCARVFWSGIDLGLEPAAAALLGAFLSEVLEGGQQKLWVPQHVESDVLSGLEALAFKRLPDSFLDRVIRILKSLIRLATERFQPSSLNVAGLAQILLSDRCKDQVLKAIFLGFSDRLCLRRENSMESSYDNSTTRGPNSAGSSSNHFAKARMIGGRGVSLSGDSDVRNAPYFVALDARESSRSMKAESIVTLASRVETDWILSLCAGQLNQKVESSWNENLQKIEFREGTYFEDIVIGREHVRPASVEESLPHLKKIILSDLDKYFGTHPVLSRWRARIDFLREHLGDESHVWPSWTEEFWSDLVEEVCYGQSQISGVLSVDLSSFLDRRLTREAQRVLSQEAPEHVKVPNGKIFAIDYGTIGGPKISVKIQEIFGWSASPKLAGGRVPLTLELLGPNFRPVQITRDLASFWKTGYFEVRKDLRARYPKHLWPENPLTFNPLLRKRE